MGGTELRARITAATKQAMRDKQPLRLSTLRLINAAIKDRDIALRGAEEGAGQGVDDAGIQAILAKMVKQRQESARIYEEGGRLELAETEREETAVIEEFMPRPLTDAETGAAIDAAVAETGATSIRDMGRVMGVLKSRHAGRMDFSAVGARVKTRLD